MRNIFCFQIFQTFFTYTSLRAKQIESILCAPFGIQKKKQQIYPYFSTFNLFKEKKKIKSRNKKICEIYFAFKFFKPFSHTPLWLSSNDEFFFGISFGIIYIQKKFHIYGTFFYIKSVPFLVVVFQEKTQGFFAIFFLVFCQSQTNTLCSFWNSKKKQNNHHVYFSTFNCLKRFQKSRNTFQKKKKKKKKRKLKAEKKKICEIYFAFKFFKPFSHTPLWLPSNERPAPTRKRRRCPRAFSVYPCSSARVFSLLFFVVWASQRCDRIRWCRSCDLGRELSALATTET